MTLPFRFILILAALVTGMVTSYSVFAEDARGEEVFDRLDGKGPSGKRVDVIEWEGNLEIHVYPKGSLSGLSAKLDDRDDHKKVMVIGYRLGEKSKPLVRRAILGVPFHAKLKGFVDRSERDFDKLAISNKDLKKPWSPYQLDPAPKQWYPDGDPRNEDEAPAPFLGEFKKTEENRAPASVPAPKQKKSTPPVKEESIDTEEGSVGHFSF